MKEMDPQHLLVKIAKILERLKIPYLVTGGMAILVWGRPRFTADIDIVIGLKPQDANALEKTLSALGKAVYVSRESIWRALRNHGEFNFIDGDLGIKVDFWVLKNDPFEISSLGRRIKKKILKDFVYFISPEDLIISKLRWYKKAQTSRHLEDIESVLTISGKILDIKYIKKWVEKLNLQEIWEKIRK